MFSLIEVVVIAPQSIPQPKANQEELVYTINKIRNIINDWSGKKIRKKTNDNIESPKKGNSSISFDNHIQ